MDFFSVGFLELMVLSENLVHVVIVYVDIDYFFALFEGLVFVVQAQFLCQLFLQLSPLLFVAELCSFAEVEGCTVGLVVFGIVLKGMWNHIESFEIIGVDDSSCRFIGVCTPIALWRGFIVIL